MTIYLFSCHRLSASISKDQCHKNRQRDVFACKGCPGLPEEPAGKVVHEVSPQKQQEASEIPTVTLRFEEPEDRELFRTLNMVCSDLEYDIVSLLHLACRGDLAKMKGYARARA